MSSVEVVPPQPPPQPPPRSSSRRLLRPVLVVVVVGSAVWFVEGFVGDIDWSQVRAALDHLAWWQLPVLVLGLLLRQLLNALPLSVYIEGCGPLRAVANDQAAILMTTIAPPPSDVVVRLAMFSSWGISRSAGLAGTVMNTVSFYVVRFAAPLLGVLVMAVTGDLLGGELWTALASGAVSAALLVVVWLSFRSPAFAASTGRRTGLLARRVRSSVDPGVWAESVLGFRGTVVDRIARTLPLSVAALVGMVVVDAGLIVLSVRFVGASRVDLPAVWVLTAFLVAYPLTLFPFSGLGLLDAVVIATLVARAGQEVEASLVAALIIWRGVTIGAPLVLGMVAVTWWRLSTRAGVT